MNRFLAVIVAGALIVTFSGLTVAADEARRISSYDPEDAKWIAKCIDDNRNQGQPAEVIRKYCECMVSKMADDETQSVTQWEKTHPESRKECDRVSGWR